MTFVLSTANPGKIHEMREILSELDIEFVTRHDLGINEDIAETGVTFKENALIKAEAICKATGMPSIADDSGLMVDALGGAPGVYTSTFGGDGLSDSERCECLLQKMANEEHRCAKFVCTIVCVFPDGDFLMAEGECHGIITTAPRGTGGFGYDPIFQADGKTGTMAELPPEEKNRISHRGLALREFAMLVRKRDIV